jgi:hypothetical protein
VRSHLRLDTMSFMKVFLSYLLYKRLRLDTMSFTMVLPLLTIDLCISITIYVRSYTMFENPDKFALPHLAKQGKNLSILFLLLLLLPTE